MAKKNVTFVLTEDLDKKIEIHAAVEGKQKSEVLTEALESYFISQTSASSDKHLLATAAAVGAAALFSPS